MVYAMHSSYTNKAWNDIPFQNEGSFWIEEQIENPFYHNEERMEIDKKNIKAVKLENEYKGVWENKNNVALYHRNEKCNIIQLLNQAKFITGIAEFDLNT